MKKKLLYTILVCIIIAGAIIIGTMGLKADIVYSKNVKIAVYLGKQYNTEEIRQMAKEVFETDRVLVQQVEYYGDMFTLTISQDVEDIDGKVEKLNNQLNEKYGLENKKEDIEVTYQPKIKLSSILMPYLLPLAISMIVILVYVLIRFRKIGIFKTLGLYILTVLATEAVYLSILAIARIPINRLVTPIGLAIYVIAITVVTAMQEKKLASYRETEGKKKNKSARE